MARFFQQTVSAEQSGSNSSPGIACILTHIAERDEPTSSLIPKHQPDALEALNEREPTGRSEFRMILQYTRQAVVRDSAAQVMNMMHADIGGEPAQNTR